MPIEACQSLRTSSSENISSCSAVITIPTSQLVEEYDSNRIAADQKYLGKRLAVEGTIEHIGKDMLNSIYINFDGKGFRKAQCFFADEHSSQIAPLYKGQRIKVEGICDGLMMHVLIITCKLRQNEHNHEETI